MIINIQQYKTKKRYLNPYQLSCAHPPQAVIKSGFAGSYIVATADLVGGCSDHSCAPVRITQQSFDGQSDRIAPRHRNPFTTILDDFIFRACESFNAVAGNIETQARHLCE
jgi:hypothetical protein